MAVAYWYPNLRSASNVMKWGQETNNSRWNQVEENREMNLTCQQLSTFLFQKKKNLSTILQSFCEVNLLSCLSAILSWLLSFHRIETYLHTWQWENFTIAPEETLTPTCFLHRWQKIIFSLFFSILNSKEKPCPTQTIPISIINN